MTDRERERTVLSTLLMLARVGEEEMLATLAAGRSVTLDQLVELTTAYSGVIQTLKAQISRQELADAVAYMPGVAA